MTKLPQFVRSRLAIRQSAPDEHPDANLLAGFAAQALSPHERENVLEHLARCPECREILALGSMPARGGKPPAIEWWKWRWAVAAAACLMAALFWRPASLQQSVHERITPSVSPSPLPEKEKTVPPAPPTVSAVQRVAAKPKATAVAPQPVLTLRQTVDLPPVTLNLARPELARVAPQTASLEMREATADFHKLAAQAQPESPAPSRTEALAMNGMFQPDRRANLAKIRPRQFSRSDEEKSLWKLDGALRKSDDGGKNWHVVPVGSGDARLYALSAAGADIWAGGEGGVLFHSVDGGRVWKPVIVANADGRLTDAITSINARDANWIELKTASGDWLTTDGGRHWQRP